ncbi:hypothetical protein V7149_16210 [Bacillus sp. JJ1503]|uniref:hypothetical protein n=1 Tax=Bacillus sp. JJ1503 TaxID=3122956 RepID=UPI00300071C8
MKRFILLLGIVLIQSFLSACSDDKYDMEYEAQLEEKDIEISKLKEELKLISDELNKERTKLTDAFSNLSKFDHKSRLILKHIANNEFDKLRSEFDVNFEVIDEKIYFAELNDAPKERYFPKEIAGLPMYLQFYLPQPENTQVGYFLYGYDQYGSERKYEIVFLFGNNEEFKYVGTN